MRIVFYFIIFSFLFIGCQQQQYPSEKLEEKKVHIYVVESDQSPVQDFTVTLTETGETAPDIGRTLSPTDVDGKTEATLKVGVTYEAYLVINDDTTQYEKFTVSEDSKDNEFTFVLKK